MNEAEHDTVIMVFARAPIPGRAKTRLIPALGARGAATLHARLLEHTLATLARLDDVDVQLYVVPADSGDYFSTLADRHSVPTRVQQGNDLGERMSRAFADNLPAYSRAILVGCDCPALTTHHYRQIQTALNNNDAAVIPAMDGGYVLMGLRRENSAIFENITWSTARVMQQTRQQLENAGFCWLELPSLPDIDRPEDLQYCPETLLNGVTHELAG